MLVPRPVGWGGKLADSGSTIGDEKKRAVPRLSYHASGTPPNVAENNNNTTIRRIYNKMVVNTQFHKFYGRPTIVDTVVVICQGTNATFIRNKRDGATSFC